MRIVLFGPPASGKGTQAQLLEKALGTPHLSTGDLLRRVAKESGSLGDAVREIPVGRFASDELIIELLKAELEKPEYIKGVVLDGFPRTVAQAEKMKEMGLKMDIAIDLHVDDGILTDRIVNRRIHTASGRIYNLLTQPPKQDGLDDVTGEPLTHRDDDRVDMVTQRLHDYRTKTQPAVETFRTFPDIIWIHVNGLNEMNEVHKDIQLGLKESSSILLNKIESKEALESKGSFSIRIKDYDNSKNPVKKLKHH